VSVPLPRGHTRRSGARVAYPIALDSRPRVGLTGQDAISSELANGRAVFGTKRQIAAGGASRWKTPAPRGWLGAQSTPEPASRIHLKGARFSVARPRLSPPAWSGVGPRGAAEWGRNPAA